jgi:hypothetical protein
VSILESTLVLLIKLKGTKERRRTYQQLASMQRIG